MSICSTPPACCGRASPARRAAGNLAAGGSIGRNAYDDEEVALALLARVREPHADRLSARYRIAEPGTMNDSELLAEIGRRRGALLSGGRISLQKAAEVVINDFRGGAWGRITLETPEQFAHWQAAAAQRDAERLALRAIPQAARRNRSRRRRCVLSMSEHPLFIPTLAFALVTALLVVVIWSIRRHRDPKLKIETQASIERMIPSLAGLTLSHAVPGNAVGTARERDLLRRAAALDRLARASRCTSRPSCGNRAGSVSASPTRWSSAPAPASRCA